ncbi:Hypothetical predicted protein [Mytilus galloprovincialis]|uniref:Uncharacterized protein n=1 Tax=Mytilus galloprovincialis TaxID=29158 RepID=A0A8B6BQH6_MYTGA|nr:Hypothetical predicted protein [Mytilus galloprovincialis]
MLETNWLKSKEVKSLYIKCNNNPNVRYSKASVFLIESESLLKSLEGKVWGYKLPKHCNRSMTQTFWYTLGGRIEKAKLKKFLSLKYSYKNAALLLLWIAWDIHKNPGPIEEPFSKRIRPVLEKICSKILKIYNGFSSNTNPKNIWTKQANFYLYDCQTDYTYMCDYKSLKTESLIDILLVCCEKKGCNTDELANEIKAWKTYDFNQLLRLHNTSTCVSEKVKYITLTLERVRLYADLSSINEVLEQLGIELNDTDFQIWLSINPTEGTRKKAGLCWEACRYITSVLCKIAKNECLDKTYAPPEDWPTEYADFKDPHNQKKNQHLKTFFKDLLQYCYDKKPDNKFLHDLKSYIGKCQEWIRCPQMQDGLLNEYVLRHDVAVIMEKLQSLQCESLLCTASTMLSERGIKLLSDKWTTEVSPRDPLPYSRKRKHYEYKTAEGPKTKSAKVK